jgi:GTP-binding protein
MLIKSAEFVTSAVKPAQYPPEGLPEIAFAGRSNVGKSSLINTLVNRRRLVKTSGRPGRTQLINFFIINDAFRLVDLPGYGYAKVPESVRRQWGPMIERYLTARESLKGVVLILDIRRTPGEEELNFIDWLAHHRLPCILVCTKADKLSKNKRKQQLHRIAGVLDRSAEDLLLFSAKTRLGKESVWSVLEALIEPGSESHDRG